MSVYLKIRIDSDNAAFEERPRHELTRTLKTALDYLRNSNQDKEAFHLRDTNGNTVGLIQWRIER
jgi:hypothetical protein